MNEKFTTTAWFYSLQENILHTYLFNGFDASSIEYCFQQINAITQNLDKWILVSHPDESAGLTPNGIQALIKGYNELQNMGCVGIVMQEDTPKLTDYINFQNRQILLPVKTVKTEDEAVKTANCLLDLHNQLLAI